MNYRGPLSRAPISVIQELQSHPEAGNAAFSIESIQYGFDVVCLALGFEHACCLVSLSWHV